MMRSILSFFLLMLLSIPVFADGADYFMPTQLGTSARMIRLGNIEGFSNLASTVFENPASMYRIRKFSASVFRTTLMNEVAYQNVAVGIRMPVGMLGVGVMAAGVNGVPKTKEVTRGDDTIFAVDHNFSYLNGMAKVAYQVSQSENLHLGAAATYYMTSFDTVRGTGYNFDVGMVIDSGVLRSSIVVKNMVSSLKVNYEDTQDTSIKDQQSSDGRTENLPLQVVFGLKYKLSKQFQFFGQLKTQGSEGGRYLKSAGVNYTPAFLPFFHVSAGWKQFHVVRSDEGRLTYNGSSRTLGLGLDLLGVNFDYAFENSEHFEFSNNHYFSIGLSF